MLKAVVADRVEGRWIADRTAGNKPVADKAEVVARRPVEDRIAVVEYMTDMAAVKEAEIVDVSY